MKCILLVEDIADKSKKIVINNLKMLEEVKYSEDEIDLIRKKSVDVDDAEVIRNVINAFIQNPVEFLNIDKAEA